MTNIYKAKFKEEHLVITLNQEEIQLACKQFVHNYYNLDTPTDNPAEGIQLKIITDNMPTGTARVEADINIT